ncbi:hypothetical protein NDU88_007830 [Pleurodeles waltl]|uniref:Uncharacterized protein n=1 Tax=Pleurodeles waltl TaxID=8319 RepID=A0AAV7N702_PLEWA|nr:hypothetical protein NDU88_007830 [Pleurodeles waltl]
MPNTLRPLKWSVLRVSRASPSRASPSRASIFASHVRLLSNGRAKETDAASASVSLETETLALVKEPRGDAEHGRCFR